jgi:RNA-directed DNA polymerase
LIDQQKNRCNLYRKPTKRGVPRRRAAAAVYSHRGRRALSNTRAVTKAYPNDWFIAVLGQAPRSDKTLPHWFDVDRWIRLA